MKLHFTKKIDEVRSLFFLLGSVAGGDMFPEDSQFPSHAAERQSVFL